MTLHHSNLCDLPDEKRQAIETDKQRWFKAYQMVRQHHINEIKAYIESIADNTECEDMRFKLNESWKNKNETTND